MSGTDTGADRPIRRSIEVEYWVVDDTGRLTDPGDLVDAAPGVEREFIAPLLEVKTTPCASTAALHEELCSRLRAVLERASETDRRLVPLSTPLSPADIADLPDDRTRIQADVVGVDFEYVRHCAGTHIHVEQQPGQAVDQLNTFVALDPALALVNSAPYFMGQRVAAGARSKLYRWLAYAGLEHQGQLWPYIDDKAEWTTRLDRRYEEFHTAALDAGFDRDTVETHFGPESAVWTPVQFREEFSTVEWRSPDTALPSQVIQLADRLATVTEHLRQTEVRVGGERARLTDEAVVLPPFERVVEYVRAAIRDGLADDGVCAYLDRMGFDVDAYDPLTEVVDTGRTITATEARDYRLEYADRLEREVRQGVRLDAD